MARCPSADTIWSPTAPKRRWPAGKLHPASLSIHLLPELLRTALAFKRPRATFARAAGNTTSLRSFYLRGISRVCKPKLRRLRVWKKKLCAHSALRPTRKCWHWIPPRWVSESGRTHDCTGERQRESNSLSRWQINRNVERVTPCASVSHGFLIWNHA